MKFILVEFIPIILLFLLLSYTHPFVNISNSILGRSIALTIILFYTYIDNTLGLLACAVIILFYQSDIVENMLNRDENFESNREFIKSKNINPQETSITKDSPLSYITQYEEPNIHNDNLESEKNEFKTLHCEKGHLVNKGQIVKTDMTEHVFPNVEFHNEKCNICDPTCNFSIIEKQVNILLSEEFTPKSGRE
jgi:hypothetical protein